MEQDKIEILEKFSNGELAKWNEENPRRPVKKSLIVIGYVGTSLVHSVFAAEKEKNLERGVLLICATDELKKELNLDEIIATKQKEKLLFGGHTDEIISKLIKPLDIQPTFDYLVSKEIENKKLKQHQNFQNKHYNQVSRNKFNNFKNRK
jgi:hypothetical protein